MRIAILIIITFCYQNLCTGQSSAHASASATIQAADDVAFVQQLMDDVLTMDLSQKTRLARQKNGTTNQVFKEDVVVTSFVTNNTLHYAVSLPAGAIVVQSLKGMGTLRLSAFKITAGRNSDSAKIAASLIEATLETESTMNGGNYVSITPLNVTIHFN